MLRWASKFLVSLSSVHFTSKLPFTTPYIEFLHVMMESVENSKSGDCSDEIDGNTLVELHKKKV